ncbi:hypothetical protein [Gluconobacter kondonii]|uniref:hypothetical protein n=1 Tax=Gluconobacter kondonii TaxID=941463 RepID=UPI001B8D9F51|nr:hypothetical protein [Gluconobacter kondonii]MBS1054106.1 hypothetical protein [Gluconobacter kondonii]MBS1055218.1 hypothetical protein [Gluconobacter kondonii]
MKKDPSIVRHPHVNAMTVQTIGSLFLGFYKKPPVFRKLHGIVSNGSGLARSGNEGCDFPKPALVICFRACKNALNKRYDTALAGIDEPF